MATLYVSFAQWGRNSITLTGDVTLTDAQARAVLLEFGGTPSSACTVTLPSIMDGAVWIVYNNSGQSVTLRAPGGTGVTVANTRRAILTCDGTDVRRVTADT